MEDVQIVVSSRRSGKKVNADKLPPSPYSAINALKMGDVATRLSFIVFGLGNLLRKQVVKGLIFLAFEIAVFVYLAMTGFAYLGKLPTLGQSKASKVKVDGFWVYQAEDNSVQILLYGVMAIFVIVILVMMSALSARSAYKAQVTIRQGRKPPTFLQDLYSLTDRNGWLGLMFLPTLGILVFTIMPLIFMISMAFTSYDQNHVVLFKWVGLQNFSKVFSSTGGSGVNARLFVSVLLWTLVWAFFATFLNFFLGMFMAMVINRKTTRLKGLWRACFSMSIAVPQFVSLLVMNTMLQHDGAINRLMMNLGIIHSPLPFLTDTTYARVIVIVVNLWVGIPYTIMQITGILQNVPSDLYEAAQIDGANWWSDSSM